MSSLGKFFTTALTNADVKRAEIVDYGDRDDFLSLWATDGNGTPAFLERMAQKSAAIIVWDGRAFEEADPKADRLKPHITPMDWALAFSIKTLDCKNAAPRAKFSIHIVDLSGEDHEKSWAMVMRHQLLFEMPWVTLHGPLTPAGAGRQARYRQGYLPILGEDGLLTGGDGGQWQLKQVRVLEHGLRLEGGKKLVDLARQWAASLVQSRDHHDLNNVVGPWIVAGIVPMESTPSLKAFWTRLDWTGFACHGSKKPPGEEPVKVDLDVLAVDDELAAGWNHVLVSKLLGWNTPEHPIRSPIALIGQSADGRLFGTPDPAVLLSHLGYEEDGEPNIEKYKRRVFDSPINDGDQTRPWLLVLDLRLFSGRPTEEREWFEKLLKIVRPMAKVPAAELPWGGFSDTEIKRVEAWISGSNDDTAYDTALSLFPRLCALRWPSVPILLFSGSGRRNLLTKLAEYGNIFLAPPKPNALAADAAEQVEMFLTNWRRKFDAAMPLVDLQRKLVALQAYKTEASDAKQDIHRHLTIAFDETGDLAKDEPFAVGGVIVEVTAENQERAKENAFSFFEALRENGVNFYDHVPAYTELNKAGLYHEHCITKNTFVNDEIKDVLKEYANCRVGVFRCVLAKNDKWTAAIDGAYLAVLTSIVELIMAEHLPSLGYGLNKTSLSVWLPTRTVPGKRDDAIRLDLSNFRITDGSWKVQTLGGKSLGYALLSLALANRKCIDKILSISAVKIRKIPYYNDLNTCYDSAVDWYCIECQEFIGVPSNNYRRWDGRSTVNFIKRKAGMGPADAHTECRIHPGTFLAADYSVASHLADACLANDIEFPKDEFGRDNVDADLSFDVCFNPSLKDFLHAGRLFDLDLPAEAFKMAWKHDFFVRGLNKGNFAKARLEKHLVHRLAQLAAHINGNAFVELAALQNSPTSGEQTNVTPRSLWRFTITNFTDATSCEQVVKQILRQSNLELYVTHGTTNKGKSKISFDLKNELHSELKKRLTECGCRFGFTVSVNQIVRR